MPVLTKNRQVFGISFQLCRRVFFWIYGKRGNAKIITVAKGIFQTLHIGIHDRANGWAGSKEKLNHINLPEVVFV